jgi:hypothetical protein
MLALEMRQRGYQVDVATAPSNIKLSEPITTFLYRATRGFLRQAMGNGTSSLITVSLEGQDASIIRVKAAITGGVQSSEAEAVTLFEQTMEMSLAGIQARSKLLGIGVSVESSPGRTSALVLDISLLDSDPL